MKNDIITKLIELNGTVVEIVITNIWYGEQKIVCPFSFINNDKCIGVKIKNNKICVLKSELTSIKNTANYYYINGERTTIVIKIK